MQSTTSKVFLIILASLILVASCKEAIVDSKTSNMPPQTSVFLDTVGTTQTTQMKLYWNGDDPDGTVIGFLYSLDSARTWNFTTETSKQVTVPTLGYDSLITKVLVAAVDNSGNGKYDETVVYNGKNIGHEFYIDKDKSGTYSSDETYYDYGAIDPSPASFFVKVKNGPPVSSFNSSAIVPAITLPVATFILQVNDPDGLEGIDRFEIALNDTIKYGWTEIPKLTSVLTLKGNLTDVTSDTISAQVLTGFDAKPTTVYVPNMLMNKNNRLFFRVKDNTGAISNISTMPAIGSPQNWFITKPQSGGKLLLIRDHFSHGFNDQDLIQAALAQTPTSTSGSFYDKVDVLYLRNPSGAQIIPNAIQNTMVSVTLNSFKKAIWYGGDNTSYSLAQSVLPKYLSNDVKGKILFRGGFAQGQTGRDLSIDFLPIDSLNSPYYYSNGTTDKAANKGFRRTPNLLTLVRDQTYSDFPTAKPDTNSYFKTLPDSLVSRQFVGSPMGTYYSFVPNQNAFVLYRLSLPRNTTLGNDLNWPVNSALYKGSGTPVVMIENTNRNLVFTTIPFNYFSGPSATPLPGYPKNVNGKTFATPLQELLYKILSEEFER